MGKGEGEKGPHGFAKQYSTTSQHGPTDKEFSTITMVAITGGKTRLGKSKYVQHSA